MIRPTHFLTTSLLVSALLLPQAAQAESSAENAAYAASAKTEATDDVVVLDSFVVTGSRLPTLAAEATVAPVTTITADQFGLYGATSLADLTRSLTQLGPNTANNTWTELIGTGPSAGLSNRTTFSLGGLNLASSSLGGVTLVLVDGRRLPKTGQAFSGQGNLEDYDLNGIPLEAIDRIEILSGGASAIYGSDAMAGVVNIILKKGSSYRTSSVTLRYEDTFNGGAAAKAATVSTTLRSGKFSFAATAAYKESDELASRDRWYTSTANLKTFGGKYDNRNSFLGAVWAGSTFYNIPAGSQGAATAGSFVPTTTPTIYDSAADSLLIDPSRERSILVKSSYSFTDWLSPYAELRWNDKISHGSSLPSIGYYYPAYSYGSGLLIPAGVAGNPLGVSVRLNKIFTDLPQRSTSTSRNPALTFGLEGDLHALNNWHYDTFYSWSRSEQNYVAAGNFDTTALAAAIAAGHAPILIYDSAAGNPNAAGVLEAFLQDDWNRERSDTSNYNLTLRGPVVTLPAGDLQVALGGEWLDNRSTFSANPDSSYSSYLLAGTISRSNTAGFVEVKIPLLSEKQKIPGLHQLALTGSARHDDYSDVGGATTANVGVLLQPVSWLSLRASRSEGFMPASLWNLYAPYYDFGGYTFPGSWYDLYDPVLKQDVGTISSFTVGHEDLLPATSVSRNLGAVLDVPFVKGLSFSADFTQTKIVNAIGSPDYQVIIDQYPDRVVRDPVTNVITALDTSAVNTGSYETQSITVGAAYRRSTAWGVFQLSSSYTNPNVTRQRYTAASTPTEAWLPKRFNTSLGWQNGGWGASLSAVYQSSFNMYPAYLSRGYDYTYASYVEWNPGLSYDYDAAHPGEARASGFWPVALRGTKVSVTVANVFNREPSLATAGTGRIAEDYRGSRYVIELRKKF